MLARVRSLELEARARELSTEDRIRGYEEAERHADDAVVRAPREPEGYLWQAIARGRIVTARGNLRAALYAMLGGRGPAWIEQTLRTAVALPERFDFFGDSTRGDALYALAQFYRLAPDAWYMSALGTRGDVDRSVELLREAVERQPERLEYHKELAVALLCRGSDQDRASAEHELRELLTLPAITPIDAIDREHAQQLLARVPENVCGYSRDGFVEFAP
jgi:tetratricopeptide (TPR) repeat protein